MLSDNKPGHGGFGHIRSKEKAQGRPPKEMGAWVVMTSTRVVEHGIFFDSSRVSRSWKEEPAISIEGMTLEVPALPRSGFCFFPSHAMRRTESN